MSKKCSWCGGKVNAGFAGDGYYCPHCNENLTDKDVLPMTVFEQITDSPEVLAPIFVFLKASFVTNLNPKQQWISTLTGEVYPTRAEAIAATVAKLKEVCDE
jgi:hypothetical protein